MSKVELLKRYIIFIIGLFINSFGVSFITKASLGTSPISSIPYTLSLGFKPTLGMFTLYMSIILIIIQIILLRKKFPKQYILQIPVSFVFSWFIDLTMSLLSFMAPETYLMKFISLIAGCIILGIGVYTEMVADVVMLPGESFVKAVSVTFHKDFGKTKVAFDSSVTIIAGIIGLILFHKFAGVREGTVISALLVGMIARFLKRKLSFVESFIIGNDNIQDGQVIKENNNIVVTISREYGSGGRQIAQELAEKLGFEYYDRNIITMTAQNSDLPEDYIEAKEQKMKNSLLYDLFSQYYALTEEETELDKLYEVEANIIKEAASKGNCVIVGRCADYILKNMDNCYNVFIHAKEDYKIKQIMEREHIDKKQALKHMRDINKKRFIHYKYYTGQIWGFSPNYNLCLDVTGLNSNKASEMIMTYIKFSVKDENIENV
ncbi:cytidylate kinase family protein [Anaerovorax odorimutans]|uniref:cytidylate kinase family protein n=1 Tax=Anaerovorax odorimutans TaxID=109327 RepID=UPI0004130095|nr:cytidylate kinase family protein [Anaerovorax odorimutans]